MNDWKECTWIEAANAYAAGTHDYQRRDVTRAWDAILWYRPIGQHIFGEGPWQYRIREKKRTITVTIPRPLGYSMTLNGDNVSIGYDRNTAQATIAFAEIRTAMEKPHEDGN